MLKLLLEILHVGGWILLVIVADIGIQKVYKKFTDKEIKEWHSIAGGFIIAFPFSPAWYICLFWMIFVISLYAMFEEKEAIIKGLKVKDPNMVHKALVLGLVVVFSMGHSFI